MDKENVQTVAEGMSAENRLFGQRINRQLLLVVFFVAFFIIIVGALGAAALQRVWEAAYTFAATDVPALSNLHTLEEIIAKQTFILHEFTAEKNKENAAVLAKLFDGHKVAAEETFKNLRGILTEPPEIALENKAYNEHKNFLSKAENVLDGENKKADLSLSLLESDTAANNLRNALFGLGDLVKKRAAQNTSALEATHADVRRNLLLVSLSGLLFASLAGVLLGRRAVVAPILSVEQHAEELTKLNSELNVTNKKLVEREIELSDVNKKLQDLDAARSEFVSIVAHQLRTPLAGIKWTLDMLINGDVGELQAEQKTMLIKMLESNERIVRFVNNLLSISRIESGRLEYNFVPTNLEHIAESVLLDIYPIANAKQVSIIFRGKGLSIPTVAADTEKIRVVFQNILENAVKYTPSGSRVTLDLRNRGNEVLVSVIDEGIGIPKDEQKGIFKRFYRAPSAVKIQAEGSGLGLYLARAIIEGHGGRLWFESEANKGSTFYFTVPIPRKMA